MSVKPPRIDRAREALTLRWDEAREDHVGRQLVRRMRRRRVVRAAGTAAALVVIVAAGLAARVRLRAPEATRDIALADGSVIERLDPRAELTVVRDSPGLTEIKLQRGAARFRVAKDAARVFRVDAEYVSVEVLGTIFVVEPRPAGVHVAVAEGRVKVVAPVGIVVLGAGEARQFEPSAPAPIEAVPAVELGGAPEVPPTTEPPNEPSKDTLKRRASEPTFNAEALLRSAEAARRAREPRAAIQALLVIVNRRPTDPRAAEAAFMLGRILQDDLDRPGAAVEHFAQARRLAPQSTFAEDALARQAECAKASGQAELARELVSTYEATYPKGVHGPRLRKLAPPVH